MIKSHLISLLEKEKTTLLNTIQSFESDSKDFKEELSSIIKEKSSKLGLLTKSFQKYIPRNKRDLLIVTNSYFMLNPEELERFDTLEELKFVLEHTLKDLTATVIEEFKKNGIIIL